MSNDETGVPLYHGDIAPGDERADGTEVAEGIRGYLIGLGLSVLATVVAFFLSWNLMMRLERLIFHLLTRF